MVYYYPDITDVNFNVKINTKEEINENKAKNIHNSNNTVSGITQKLCTSIETQLLPQQQLLGTYLAPNTPYNGLLIFHGTGVGKTCTAITIAEQYKSYLSEIGKKIRIICSKDLIPSFKKTIINPSNSFKCTGETYIKEILSESKSGISKAISAHYEFLTYYTFAEEINKTVKNLSEDDAKIALQEKYSDSLIIIDEAQNIRNNAKGNENTKGSKLIVQMLELLTENTYNLKLVLLSATPMYDSPDEIIWLLNLIQRVYKHPLLSSKLIDKNGSIPKEKEQEFITAIQGKVSYLKGENPYTFPFKLQDSNAIDFKSLPTKDLDLKTIKEDDRIKTTPITPSYMSNEYYNQLQKLAMKKDFYSKQSQLHNVCWSLDPDDDPSTLFGIQGLKKIFRFNNDTMPSFFSFRDPKINQLNDIHLYSPKLKTILNIIKNSKGPIMIHSRFVYSGIVPIALMLENSGYTKYSKHGGISQILDNAKPKKNTGSYAMFTADENLSGNKEKLLNIFNQSSNKDGEIIKVILISPVGGEGITLKRVREVHLLEPQFNKSDQEQSIGRAIRTCSHMDLPFENRNCTVYYHANMFPNKDHESVDVYLHRKSEIKQKYIDSIKYLIQQNAFDCALLRDINFFSPSSFHENPVTIVDSQGKKRSHTIGDPIENEKKGECKFSYDKNNTDSNTYSPINHQVEIVNKMIKDLIGKYIEIKSDDIYIYITELYPTIHKKSITYALDTLVSHNIIFDNLFGEAGYIEYIRENDMYVFNKIKKNEYIDTPPPFIRNYVPLNTLNLPERDSIQLSIKNVLEEYTRIQKYLPSILENTDLKKKKVLTVLAQIVVDKLSNKNRITHLQKDIDSIDNLYLLKAYHKYIKDIRGKSHIISIPSNRQGIYINNEDATSTFDILSDSTKKNSLKQKDLFGYININANQSDFHIVHKIANKKPRGSKAFNSKKNVLTSLINKLLEKEKYIHIKDNRKLVKKDDHINAEHKTITSELLCVELETLLRLSKDGLFFNPYNTIVHDVYSFLHPK